MSMNLNLEWSSPRESTSGDVTSDLKSHMYEYDDDPEKNQPTWLKLYKRWLVCVCRDS